MAVRVTNLGTSVIVKPSGVIIDSYLGSLAVEVGEKIIVLMHIGAVTPTWQLQRDDGRGDSNSATPVTPWLRLQGRVLKALTPRPRLLGRDS